MKCVCSFADLPKVLTETSKNLIEFAEMLESISNKKVFEFEIIFGYPNRINRATNSVRGPCLGDEIVSTGVLFISSSNRLIKLNQDTGQDRTDERRRRRYSIGWKNGV